MEPELNPYAPPAQWGPNTLPNERGRGIRREGDLLLAVDGAILPSRCIRTNEPTDSGGLTKTRKLTWYPRWIWVFTLVGLIPVSVILASLLQKNFSVTYSLSRRERARFESRLALGWLLFTGAFVQMTVAVALAGTDSGIWAGIVLSSGILMMIAGGVFIFRAAPLRAVSCANGSFGLKGCSEEFLDSVGPA